MVVAGLGAAGVAVGAGVSTGVGLGVAVGVGVGSGGQAQFVCRADRGPYTSYREVSNVS